MLFHTLQMSRINSSMRLRIELQKLNTQWDLNFSISTHLISTTLNFIFDLFVNFMMELDKRIIQCNLWDEVNHKWAYSTPFIPSLFLADFTEITSSLKLMPTGDTRNVSGTRFYFPEFAGISPPIAQRWERSERIESGDGKARCAWRECEICNNWKL